MILVDESRGLLHENMLLQSFVKEGIADIALVMAMVRRIRMDVALVTSKKVS